MDELETFLAEATKGWDLETLFQVVELVVGLCDETKQDPLTIDSDTILAAEEDLDRFPAIRIRNLSAEDIRLRFTAVRMLNRQLAVVLPLVDFSQTHLSWSLAHSVCKLTGNPTPISVSFPIQSASLGHSLYTTWGRAHISNHENQLVEQNLK